MIGIGKPVTCTASRLGAQTKLGLEISGGWGTLEGLISGGDCNPGNPGDQGSGGTGRLHKDPDPRAPSLPDFTEFC